MKKKYLYNNQIMDATDVMDAAKQSNMDIDNYIQKAGIKEINDTYSLNGKEYTAEDILDAANQSKLGFDDYIQKAGFENTFKKKESSVSPSSDGNLQSNQSNNQVLQFKPINNTPSANIESMRHDEVYNNPVAQQLKQFAQYAPKQQQQTQQIPTELASPQQITEGFNNMANKFRATSDNTQFNPAQQSLEGQEAIQNQPKINAEKKQLHDEAVDNSIQKYFNNKGINAPKGSALYNQQKAEVENALNNGIVQVGIDPKTGERGLYKTTSFWQDLKNGWNESVKGSDDAANWNSWTPQQQVDYLDSNESSQDKNSPFLGNKSSYYGSVGKFIGGSAPTLGKTALGALLGATLVAAAPETGGMSLEGLSAASAFMFTAPDMINQSSMNEQIRAYYQIRKDNPNISKTDAMQQAHSRMWAGGTQGLLNAALMTEGQLPNLEKGISGESKGVLLNAFNHTVKPAIRFGVASGGITAATEAEGNLEGVNTDANQIFNDSMKSAGENASQAFLLGLAFHAPTLVPALLKNAAKYGLVKNANLDEIQKIEQLNESVGNTPQGTTQQVMDDLRGYKQALDKTPESLTPDTKAQVAGLIQKKDNIQVEAQTKDEATQNIYETQIDGINNQIKKEVESNEPYQHEVDNLTGNTYAEELKNSEQLQPESLNAGKEEASSVSSEGDKRSDADIENRMTELSKLHDDASNKEFDLLEKEMAKRERATVFNVPISEAKNAIDALMKKEKEMPNGWGSFITKRDASESKSVIDDYSNPKDISDDQLKRDFKNALMGRPATWYADGLKLRESMKEAANRGIDINDMLKEIAKEFTKDGYDINTAKEMIAYYLKPVFEGSQKVETNKNRVIEPSINAAKGEASSVSSERVEPNQSFRTIEMGNDEGKDETPEARKQMKVRMSNGDIPMDGENGKGETGKQFANRILSAWNNVKDNEPENTTVVTHSSVLKAIKTWEDLKDKFSGKSSQEPIADEKGNSLKDKVKGTKVSDKEGNPVVVYHGSGRGGKNGGIIEKFDESKVSKNEIDFPVNGFFFAGRKAEAEIYGGSKNTGSYYVDIKNPASRADLDAAINEAAKHPDYDKEKGEYHNPTLVRKILIEKGFDGYIPTPFGKPNIAKLTNGEVIKFDGKYFKYDKAKDEVLEFDDRYNAENLGSRDALDVMSLDEFKKDYSEKGIFIAFKPEQIHPIKSEPIADKVGGNEPNPNNLTPEQWKQFATKFNSESTDNGDLETFKGKNGNIHVIRHGQTEDNENNKFRSGNTPLTEKGIKQAEQSGKELNNLTNGEVPKIISSDLPRAMHSSDIINSQLKTKENAIKEGQQPESNQPEHTGVPQGENIPENVSQVREEGRRQTSGSGSNETSGEEQEKINPEESDEDTTSIKNSTTNLRREQFNLNEEPKVAKKEFGDTWDEAKKKIEDGYDPQNLVEELYEKPRPVSDVENAILLHYQNSNEIKLENINNKINQAAEKNDQASLVEYKAAKSRVLDTLQRIYDVDKKVGTENARGLASRQMISDRKYSLANMVSEMRATINDGKPLTEEQQKEVEELHKKIKETKKEFDDYRAESEKEIKNLQDKLLEKKIDKKSAAQKLRELADKIEKSKFGKAELGEGTQIQGASLDLNKAVASAMRLIADGLDKGKELIDLIKDAIEKIKSDNPDLDEKELERQIRKQVIESGIVDKTSKAAKDYSVLLKNGVIDRQALKLKANEERAKNEFDIALKKGEAKKRTVTQKIQDVFVKWQRGFKLSNPITIGKLMAAGFTRLTTTPLEDIVGAGYSKLLPKLAKGAIGEGGGLNVKETAKAYKNGLIEGMKDAYNYIQKGKHGKSDIDIVFGNKGDLPPEAIDFFGQLHSATKAPIKRFAFERSLNRRLRRSIANGIDVSDPMVQTSILVDSYKDANRAIFMQDNSVATGYQKMIHYLNQIDPKTGNPKGKITATTLQWLLPFVKVPTNIAAEIGTHVYGVPVAGAKIIKASFDKGLEKLSPEEKDIIFRNLKKGTLGLAAMTLGYMNPDTFGGFYQQGEKRRDDEADALGLKLGGVKVPAWFIEAPIFQAMQLGATIRRVKDGYTGKNKGGLSNGIWAGALGLADRVPFVDQPMRVAKMFDPKDRGYYLGELAKSTVDPAMLSYLANVTDPNNTDQSTSEKIIAPKNERSPKTVMEHIKSGLPFLREQVPMKSESFTNEDLKNPTFKYFSDKRLELPNTAHTSESILNEKKGTEYKLSDYPQDIQDQYDQIHKQELDKALSSIDGRKEMGNKQVYVKTVKDAQGNNINTVSLTPPATKYKKVKMDDLSKDELAQVLHLAQSQATTNAKQKILKVINSK